MSLQSENVRFVQSRNVRFHGVAEGPMETERIALSQPERDRLKVLHEVQQRQLTQRAAAARLQVSDRQVRRMLLRDSPARRRCLDSRITRPAIESQAGAPLRAEDPGAAPSALCRFRAHAWPPNTWPRKVSR